MADNTYTNISDLPTLDTVGENTWVPVEVAGKQGKKVDLSTIGEQKQADWNQTDDTQADFIKNKPTIPEAQVNADWNASSGVAQILNKPTIPTVIPPDGETIITNNDKLSANYGPNNKTSGYSFAYGSGNSAFSGSISVGVGNSARNNAISVGSLNSAYTNSITVGARNSAHQGYVFGGDNKADYTAAAIGANCYSNYKSMAVGDHASAISTSFSFGDSAYAYKNSVTFGTKSKASESCFIYGNYTSADSNSIAIGGYNNVSKDSTGIGRLNNVSGDSYAVGSSNTAVSGGYAYGNTNNVSGKIKENYSVYYNYAYAFGGQNTAKYDAFAVGYKNDTKYNSITIGSENNGSYSSIVYGINNSASNSAISIGINNSADTEAVTIGTGLTGKSGTFVIGTYNEDKPNLNFVISNGFYKTYRENYSEYPPDLSRDDYEGTPTQEELNDYIATCESVDYQYKMNTYNTDEQQEPAKQKGWIDGQLGGNSTVYSWIPASGFRLTNRNVVEVDKNGNMSVVGTISANKFNMNGEDIVWTRMVPTYTNSDIGKVLAIGTGGSMCWKQI